MKINEGLKLDFKDVLIEPKRSFLQSRRDVEINRTFKTVNSKQEISGFPIIAANMDTVGTFDMARALSNYGMYTALHKHYTENELIDFLECNFNLSSNLFYTVGTSKKDYEKFKQVKTSMNYNLGLPFPKMLCIDVANGYTSYFCDTVKKYRQENPETVIMAGNVVTPNMVEELISCGADIIKIGIGQGSCCLTRIKTGVGFPQLSAVVEAADAAHGLGGLVCSDGGCVVPGDICKAFGAGADFVMLGGMFAATDQCEGDWECDSDGNKKTFVFYGMSSSEAMKKHNGGVAEHRTSEGKAVKIPYKGDVKGVALDIQGGVRSACTYVGASRLKDFSKCCTFNRVTSQSNEVYGKNA